MSSRVLPERASLEHLRKQAKDQLQELRRSDAGAKLATALYAVARSYGFASWRALKAEVDRRRIAQVRRFVETCGSGDHEAARVLLIDDPSLASATETRSGHGGWSALHEAARRGHADVVRLLLARGANPDAREAGDQSTPLHWAAAHGDTATVRILLEAGADVNGFGDAHALDVIGWAALFRPPGEDPAQLDERRAELLGLLVERGARHHVFSAIALGDPDLVRRLVEDDPALLERRMSRFEQGMTALHFAVSRGRHDLVEVLIELGADLDAVDGAGRSPVALAMLRGDGRAVELLHDAGAELPSAPSSGAFAASMASLGASVRDLVPMLRVPDVGRSLAWYTALGFRELTRYEEVGLVNFGMVEFGEARIMFSLSSGEREPCVASLWLYTDQLDALYQQLKAQQLLTMKAALAGDMESAVQVEFVQDLETMFYGARQFCIRDPDGFELYFIATRKG